MPRALPTDKLIPWSMRVMLVAAWLYGATQLFSVACGDKQQDFRTYYNGVVAHGQGLDPYRLDSLRRVSGDDQTTLKFVYPPHCLALFRPFTRLRYATAYYLYLALKLAALLALVLVWMRIVPAGRRDWAPLFITVMLGYRSAVLRDVKIGNVSTFEQLALWGGILLVIHNRSVLGGAGILLSSIFKLITVGFGFLVFLVHRTWRAFAVSTILVAGGIAGYAGLLFNDVARWKSFVGAVGLLDERGNRNPSSVALLRDVQEAAGMPGFAVYAAYAALCCLVLAILARAFFAARHSKDVYPMLYLAILGYVVLVPRMKDYSLMIALVPTLHAISAMAPRRWLSLIGAVLLWIPLIKYQSLLLSAYAFGLVAAWIWRCGKDPDRRAALTLNPLRGFDALQPRRSPA